jgi:RNA polymerase sigma-70 factor, ECF subfamily
VEQADESTSMNAPTAQDTQYQQATQAYGGDIARFVAGYERDPARRQELLQEVHLSLWQSFAGYRGQCSLRTWGYRVAHNVGVSHVQRSLRAGDRHGLTLDEAETVSDEAADIGLTDRRLDLQRVLALVHRLAALDRELMLLYLEDLDAAAIGEVTGLSARNVATKIHRIKALLANQLGTRSSTS